MRAYARAVYRSTDASIAALPVNAFNPARRGSPASVLTTLLLTASMRRGELACLATFTFDRTERHRPPGKWIRHGVPHGSPLGRCSPDWSGHSAARSDCAVPRC